MCKVHFQSSKQNYYAQKHWIETTYVQQYAFFLKIWGAAYDIKFYFETHKLIYQLVNYYPEIMLSIYEYIICLDAN